MTSRWWPAPFGATTWRRTLAAVLALPAGLAALPLALLGGHRAAARMQRALARRYLWPRLGPRLGPGGEPRLGPRGEPRLGPRLGPGGEPRIDPGGGPSPGPPGGDRPGRVAAHAVLTLPVAAAAFAVAVAGWGNAVRNLTYPLWHASPADWGGPSLAGRWAVHGAGGVAFALLTPPAVLALTRLYGALTRSLLGPGRRR